MSRALSRRSAAVGALAVGLLALGPVGAARAVDGPGYGGTARDLTVTWVAPAQESSATAGDGASAHAGGAGRLGAAAPVAGPAAAPAAAPAGAGLALDVRGLGFRSSSLVTVRVGATEAFTARTDTAGALVVSVPASLTGRTQPGVSVVAAGRNPAGTAITLVGSVPPVPAGTGPQDTVVWLVAAVLGSWGAVTLVRRLRREEATA